jgi:hypothetical protein
MPCVIFQLTTTFCVDTGPRLAQKRIAAQEWFRGKVADYTWKLLFVASSHFLTFAILESPRPCCRPFFIPLFSLIHSYHHSTTTFHIAVTRHFYTETKTMLVRLASMRAARLSRLASSRPLARALSTTSHFALYRNESWKPTSPSSKFTADLSLQARSFSSQPPGGRMPGQPWVNPDNEVPGKFLEQYSVDLTKMAKDNKLDPVIGRHEEIRRTLQILARRTKNNPVLIGKPQIVLLCLDVCIEKSWRRH